MTDLQVRIVRLDPVCVACSSGFGDSPEEEAWTKLMAWAEARGLQDELDAHRFFGFNNPNPAPGSPNYGYDQWMTVGPGAEPTEDVEIKEFAGGLYAVARCAGLHTIAEDWKRLVRWREDSRYKTAHHQWLEELLTSPTAPPEELVFDLYLPIAE
jgi:DNA gyrase inhibitor GyrI